MSKIHIAKRGCGWPKEGGGYFYVAPSDLADLFSQLLIDPPVSMEGFNLSPVGMSIRPSGNFDKDGREIYHIWDWIGSSGYTNPTDWIEEIRELGFHQLMVSPGASTLPLHLLSEDSCYFAVHSRAGITDIEPYNKKPFLNCVTQTHRLLFEGPREGYCISQLYEDIIGDGISVVKDRVIEKTLACGKTYLAFTPPEDADGKHFPAVFFRLPIGKLGGFIVYEDKLGQSHEKTMANLGKLQEGLFTVEIVQIDGGQV